MNDDQKRHLLSAALLWIGEVEWLNAKVAFHHDEATRQFASATQSDVAGRLADDERSRTLDTDVLRALRERFGPHLANSLFTHLIYTTVTDLHVFVLALEHIRNAAQRLRPALSGDAAEAAREYVSLWNRVGDVRDALEHEEEYLAGMRRKPRMVAASWTPPWVGSSRHNETSSDGLVAIFALGKRYQLREVIDCCLTRVGPRFRKSLAPLSRSAEIELRAD